MHALWFINQREVSLYEIFDSFTQIKERMRTNERREGEREGEREKLNERNVLIL
jgi:hypothetical protein